MAKRKTRRPQPKMIDILHEEDRDVVWLYQTIEMQVVNDTPDVGVMFIGVSDATTKGGPFYSRRIAITRDGAVELRDALTSFISAN